MCKQVTFHTIEIIELPIRLGKHPAMSGGPTVTTEWNAQKRTIFNLDFFETYRPARLPTTNSLKISKDDREQLLLNHGFTWRDINEASKEEKNTKNQTTSITTTVKSMSFRQRQQQQQQQQPTQAVISSNPNMVLLNGQRRLTIRTRHSIYQRAYHVTRIL